MPKKSAFSYDRTPRPAARPRRTLDTLACALSCRLSSIGDVEQLAGIDIQSQKERRALWAPFIDATDPSSQRVIDAVMDHCSAIALKRIKAGKLCLWSPQASALQSAGGRRG